MLSGGAGRLGRLGVTGGLRGVPFIDRRRRARGGARSGKDAPRARHIMVGAARRALIILQSDGTRLVDEVKVRIATRHEVSG
jgi:hypothetical protein